MNDKPKIRMAFNSHGLGDVVHCCHAMKLYQSRGYDVAVQVEANKRWAWEAAGIPIHHGDQLPVHPYYYPDMGKFFDLAEPDHIYSKIAHLFEVAELPKLGTKEDVWQGVCSTEIDATPAVSTRALDDAARFLEGLPQPIILLHSKGTNWQVEKSIPDGIAFQLILDLLGTGGSVITLDWDSRAPTLGHDRVRGIKPNWHHISLEEFGALCILADLFIGVDSGPFHLAGWFDIPTLYVSRKIPPVRCCLPDPMATYLVASKDHEHWAARGNEWRFAEYQGAEATVQDIVVTALSILEPKPTLVVTMQDLYTDQIPGRYKYVRVDHDEREIELLADGRIGQGAAACERTWKFLPTPVGQALVIYGDNGGDTCHLTAGEDGIFRGRWLSHERMPIELIPVRQAIVPQAANVLPSGHPSDSRSDAPIEFYVGIPTYICFDLLDKCIEAILESDWLPRRIYVVDNSQGQYKGHASRRVQVFTPPKNLGAGGAWNFLYPAVLPYRLIMLNDDIEIAPDLLRAMNEVDGDVIVGDGSTAFTACMIRQTAWERVGPLDPVFWPAYYEDCDWAYRAQLAGIPFVCPRSGGFKNNGPSATKARMTPQDRGIVDRHYGINTDYYLRKWGGPPHQEKFTVPFNGVPQR